MGIAAAAGAKIEKNVPAELTAPGIHAPAEIGEEQVPETETEETVPETPEITPEEPEIIPEIPAATVDHYISVSSIVNVRSGPGTSYSSLGKTDIGDMFSYRGETGNWYKTTYMRKDAYISKSFASVYEIKKGSDKVEAVIDFAETLLGYPYVYGAERYLSASGKINSSFKADVFDCSSFTQYAYYMGAGIKLGLTTRDQVLQGTEVKKADIQRGDLLFFTNASRKNNTGLARVGHVAIYLGDNYILHTASDYAVIEKISTARWGYFITARRFI